MSHLSETNRDVLGTGHWNTLGFLAELRRIGYRGYCSIGVYNTRLPRRDCVTRCMAMLQPLFQVGAVAGVKVAVGLAEQDVDAVGKGQHRGLS